MKKKYEASTAENHVDILNIAGLEARVKDHMSNEKGAFGYISGGSEDEWTKKQNTESFNKRKISPRVLQGIDYADLSTKLWDIDLKTPIIQAPSAAQGLAHVKGETDTAKGVAAAGSIFSISTYASTSIEDAAAAAPDAPQFFQLYMSKDDKFNEFLIKKAVAAGAKAIVLTVDSTLGGYREADVANKFQFPLPMPNLAGYSAGDGEGKGISEIYASAKQGIVPTDIEKIKNMSGLPVIVKGIQSPDDAELAIDFGADGIWVSNHGGRQLDGGPASFEVLPDIADAVDQRVPVIFDSGVRRGEHVFKALASGADLVAIGRPIIYGLNLGGAQGVTDVIEHLNMELSITMQLAGTKTINDVKNTELLW
ncbi:L-lactate oxidase [Companilactobacillus paralimentarius DSM 13238 = JCM 10415]|uniref:L-lactate oxidase n=1 Tax=Companilactobacillus paralimentarius DSM 13238 = JCM 10415 TaxID=1122151 RepID=A0A0R1PG98_9LACO|nr:lactate oxidase [Companilactobacillus paralimentarius]KAE9565172.1 lactate oxidase [Companilactobacillus paralimentarius]KRL31421.1 L-lactate oxidase [Companilactobacillus paralimentarius DSM 13238 = JCM 10415]MDR4933622.1 lactate oxidase [Companilactobacillus paralimentarius]QFR70081.1 lactate oxidase [Companilactobacillus paralimentarius]